MNMFVRAGMILFKYVCFGALYRGRGWENAPAPHGEFNMCRHKLELGKARNETLLPIHANEDA
jgi:hypothetical protein